VLVDLSQLPSRRIRQLEEMVSDLNGRHLGAAKWLDHNDHRYGYDGQRTVPGPL
jgi:hypothetical protein